MECTDLKRLDEWARRAITATSAADLFAEEWPRLLREGAGEEPGIDAVREAVAGDALRNIRGAVHSADRASGADEVARDLPRRAQHEFGEPGRHRRSHRERADRRDDLAVRAPDRCGHAADSG